MDSDLFITFVLHHRGKFLRDEYGELIYDNEEINVWEDVDPDKCCPWLARDLAKQHGYRDFKEVWWHNKQFNLEKCLRLLKKDADVRDMCLIARQFDYEAHIYFEHQVDVPVFSKTAQAKESLGSIEVGRKTCDVGEGEGDVHMEDIQHATNVEGDVHMEDIEHAANVEGDVHMRDIQHAAYVEDDMNEDEYEASGSNKMSSSDDYESAEDSVYRPSPPLVEESDDGSSEKNEGRDGISGEETMEANPTLKRIQNFRAWVAANKKKKEIPNEAHVDSEEEERATYQFYMQPVLGKDLWQKTDYIGPVPPPIKRKPRRPKKNRRIDASENLTGSTSMSRKTLPMHFRRCGAEGHNSRKCPLPPPPPPTTDTDPQHVAAESNPNPPCAAVVSTPNHGALSATTHSPRAMPPPIAKHVTQETFNAASTSTQQRFMQFMPTPRNNHPHQPHN
ncbi:hypothetical protein SESBI_39388 [Sesbania bispinosa]|nr:hypothetical protein SESBI_39388 [Sesbania bispinosa]